MATNRCDLPYFEAKTKDMEKAESKKILRRGGGFLRMRKHKTKAFDFGPVEALGNVPRHHNAHGRKQQGGGGFSRLCGAQPSAEAFTKGLLSRFNTIRSSDMQPPGQGEKN